MSLFDVNDLISIKLYYMIKPTDTGNKLLVLEDEKAKELLKNPEKSKEIELLETKWRSITWRESNEVMEEATKSTNLSTGDKQFNFVQYRDSVIKRCLKEWNLKENNIPVPVTPQNIDRLPAKVIMNLYSKFDTLIDYNEDELGK